MKIELHKIPIKEAVKEAIHEEMKDILLEAVKSPKSTINEGSTAFKNSPISHQIPKTAVDSRQAYMDILKETAEGPKSGFEGEFKVS
ncbi:MAG: hypothetical protein AABY22_24970, partial [Nanoarchaeota archaeon]